MLKNLITKPLELNIDGKGIMFKSLDDFEFAMETRTLVPQERIIEAVNATPGELDLESNSIVVAIEKISELLNQSSEQGEVTQKLKAINSVVFSNDNNWRDIFFALKKDHSTESSKYKLIALSAYLQYLTNRQEMVQSIKARFEIIHGQHGTTEFKTGELDIDDNFDSTVLAKELGMKRMPTAEYVVIELNEGQEIALLLANYKCKLIFKNGIKFVDNENEEYPMIIGLNKIGRGRECNVRFTDTMQRISRLHLMLINHDNKKLELTDLSTYGTYYLQKSI
ncbi:MAG: FHA domain-containing protein [Proteobacteria bacterium]|nr:FHA domain-containing protein [Pseudomonadota bacterium]NOG61235.1 FHA domain-containing protein [Pseudomonadota bacterium]